MAAPLRGGAAGHYEVYLAMQTTSIRPEFVEPLAFELSAPLTHISFTTADGTGAPVLVFRHRAETRTFRGEEVRMLSTEIGVLVTVTLGNIPDLEMNTLTVLLPAVNTLPSGETPVETHVIRTTTRTSIGGPRLVNGQIQLYETLRVAGRATGCVA